MGILNIFKKKGTKNLPAVSKDYPQVGMARQQAYIKEKVRLAKIEGKKMAQPKKKTNFMNQMGYALGSSSTFGAFGTHPVISGRKKMTVKGKKQKVRYVIVKGKAVPLDSSVKKAKPVIKSQPLYNDSWTISPQPHTKIRKKNVYDDGISPTKGYF